MKKQTSWCLIYGEDKTKKEKEAEEKIFKYIAYLEEETRAFYRNVEKMKIKSATIKSNG